MDKPKLLRAYNAKSTRPIWHLWKPLPATGAPADFDGEPTRLALCGAKARDDMLDANTDHVHGCGRCDERARKLEGK